MTIADDIEPAEFDQWEEPTGGCPGTLTVVIGGEARELACENDAGHEPPCEANIHWIPR